MARCRPHSVIAQLSEVAYRDGAFTCARVRDLQPEGERDCAPLALFYWKEVRDE